MYNLFNRILKTRSIILSYKAYPNFFKIKFSFQNQTKIYLFLLKITLKKEDFVKIKIATKFLKLMQVLTIFTLN